MGDNFVGVVSGLWKKIVIVCSSESLCATASDETYNETIQINNALDGRTIQEHPKLKADKKMYYMTVEIRKVLGEDQSGITLLAVGEEGPVVLVFFRLNL